MSDQTKWICWMDLETTGLDPRIDGIIEVAASLALFDDPYIATPIYHAVLKRFPHEHMHSKVIDMHIQNGLWAESMKSQKEVQAADFELSQILHERLEQDERMILGGFSVHFDLAFLRKHMPASAKCFRHNVFDVSAIKYFCQSMGMPQAITEKQPTHRAKDDVLEAIAHARACEEWIRSHDFT